MDATRYWWVNQAKTFNYEFPGGYLWSPQKRGKNKKYYFYDTMKEVKPGDIVLCYWGSRISAWGQIQSRAQSSKMPERWKYDQYKLGWKVDVSFSAFENPICPIDFIDQLEAPLAKEEHPPLQKNGKGKEFYLTEISKPLFELFWKLCSASENETPVLPEEAREAAENQEEAAINSSDELDSTEKEQLIKSRRGQGKFKANLKAIERGCRISGVTQEEFLIGSHIKPWCKCTNKERLDGNNGLLLPPTLDFLFGNGYITFTGSGEVLVTNKVPRRQLTLIGLPTGSMQVGAFNKQQQSYLEYHREHEFEKRFKKLGVR